MLNLMKSRKAGKTLLQTLLFFLLITQISFAQWYQQNSGTIKNLHSVNFTDANNGWAVGDSGTILKTTDLGNSWNIQPSGTTHNLNDIQFVDANNGWIVGGSDYWPATDQAVVLKTTNGGTNWFRQFTDTTYFLNAVYFVDANIGWAVGTGWTLGGNSSMALKTTNGGTDWAYQPVNIYFEGEFNDVQFINANTGFIVGGGFNGYSVFGSVIKTTDGGETWDEQIPIAGWRSISFLDSQNGIVVGSFGTMGGAGLIARTTDGGLNWHNALEPSPIVFSCVSYLDSNNAWTAGLGYYEGSTIYFSSDQGLTWTSQIDSGLYPHSLNDIYFINSTSGWAVGDNGLILHTTNGGVPVELTSFTATLLGNELILNWSTATETNNQGFEILRFAQNDSEWQMIGFVPGFGTTTEPKSYSYTDSEVLTGEYTYRLKHIDFDGSYEYSQEVEVEVATPFTFSLEQNYPNPFNPNTTIKYSIPELSNVKLLLFNLLGEEVTTLVNEEKNAGNYSVEFNASSIPSGIYFYQLKVGNYIDTKKMISIK
jgi:photosystem II stability/assembly factor-like uncharacterized protein